MVLLMKGLIAFIVMMMSDNVDDDDSGDKHYVKRVSMLMVMITKRVTVFTMMEMSRVTMFVVMMMKRLTKLRMMLMMTMMVTGAGSSLLDGSVAWSSLCSGW